MLVDSIIHKMNIFFLELQFMIYRIMLLFVVYKALRLYPNKNQWFTLGHMFPSTYHPTSYHVPTLYILPLYN